MNKPMLDSTREILLAHPNEAPDRRLAIAGGATIAAMMVSMLVALTATMAVRVLAAVLVGSACTMWIRVALDQFGPRARVRRAYVAWLEAVAAEEALVEVIALHREIARGPHRSYRDARARLETAMRKTEAGGLVVEFDRWDRVKEILRTILDVECLAAEAQREALTRARFEATLAAAARQARIAVRPAAPRVREPSPAEPRSDVLVYEGQGVHPHVEGAVAASTMVSGERVDIVTRPSLESPLRESTRWAPFATTGPFSDELLELFGSDDEVLPPLDAGPPTDAETLRVGMQHALSEGYAQASRGVAIESPASAELLASKEKSSPRR